MRLRDLVCITTKTTNEPFGYLSDRSHDMANLFKETLSQLGGQHDQQRKMESDSRQARQAIW